MFDLRSILKAPIVYTTYQKIVGGIRARRLFVENDTEITPQHKVLDIGCGPGDILNFLPKDIDYTGIDIDDIYIKKAQSKNIKNADFYCTTLNDFKDYNPESFDVIISTGVIHHLNDKEAHDFYSLAKKALKPNGKLITFDGCYIENQNPISKKFLDLDRGQFVRTEKAYLELAKQHFKTVNTKIDETYFRIPYTSLILTCEK